MKAWLQAQVRCEENNTAYVLISVVALKGSSPRGVGSKMLVTADAQFDSIGGGHLEYKAISEARKRLLQDGDTQLLDYALGANLGQCCGGKVSLMYEVFSDIKLPVVVFGAGHVGRALVPLLAQLPVQVTWVDGRYDMLPSELPVGVRAVHEEYPQDHVADCQAGTCYLIMTHHHGLDLSLTEAVIKRNDAAYLGVIGSVTKGRKFNQRLRAKGHDEAHIESLNCPMGKQGIEGKQPMEVAIAIAAQVMDLYQSNSGLAGSTAPHKNTNVRDVDYV